MSVSADLKREELRVHLESEKIRADFELQRARIEPYDAMSTSIPLYDWKTLHKERITYRAGMEFALFQHAVKVAFSLQSDFRIYSLPPNALIHNKIRVDSESFHRILGPFVRISHEALPVLYVFSDDESPTKLPEVVDKALSRNSRSSTSQGSLRTTVVNRDKMCIFCGDDKSNLAAAHILDHHRETPELIKSLGLMEIDDYRNAISLCQTCHRFYDSHMLCVHPESLSLIVCNAFLSCSPHREKYEPLNGSRLRISDEAMSMNQYPNELVLKDRYECFLRKSEERRTRNLLYPYYCPYCNRRWKSLRGMNNHTSTCRNDHNCTTSSHKVGNYETPSKISASETCDHGVEDDSDERGVDEDENDCYS
jgi:hypothetical protein